MTYSFSSLQCFFSWGHLSEPSAYLLHLSVVTTTCVFCITVYYIEMSGMFSLSSRMLKLGCEAGSHVCFGRITCLLLWDGLLITHTLTQYTALMQLLSMSVCESDVQVSGYAINNVTQICDCVHSCMWVYCLWCFYEEEPLAQIVHR